MTKITKAQVMDLQLVRDMLERIGDELLESGLIEEHQPVGVAYHALSELIGYPEPLDSKQAAA